MRYNSYGLEYQGNRHEYSLVLEVHSAGVQMII